MGTEVEALKVVEVAVKMETQSGLKLKCTLNGVQMRNKDITTSFIKYVE